MAGLVAAALTNANIAARLNLSVRSVEAYLRAIRAKLGLRSRAQVAAWATAQADRSV